MMRTIHAADAPICTKPSGGLLKIKASPSRSGKLTCTSTTATSMTNLKAPQFRWHDLGEIAVGASIVAFPVAITDEVWTLSAELSFYRVLSFAIVSIFLLSTVIFLIHRHDQFPLSRGALVVRVAMTYSVTLLISMLLLFGIDRIDLLQEPLVAIKRVVIVAFPASFAATAVDSFTDRSRDD